MLLRRTLSSVTEGLHHRPLPAADLSSPWRRSSPLACGLAPGETLVQRRHRPVRPALGSRASCHKPHAARRYRPRRQTQSRCRRSCATPPTIAPTPRSGTRTSSKVDRSTRTPSRRSSAPAPGPPTCCPFWTSSSSWTAVLEVCGGGGFGLFLVARSACASQELSWPGWSSPSASGSSPGSAPPPSGCRPCFHGCPCAPEHVVHHPDLLRGCRRWRGDDLRCSSFLTGQPESSFHTLLLTAAFFVLQPLWQARRAGAPLPARGPGEPPSAWSAVWPGEPPLAAMALNPLFAELLSQSSDLVDHHGSSFGQIPFPFQDVLGLVFPDFSGHGSQNSLPHTCCSSRPVTWARSRCCSHPIALRPAALGGTGGRRPAQRPSRSPWPSVCPRSCRCMTRLQVLDFGAPTPRLIISAILSTALLAGRGLDEPESPHAGVSADDTRSTLAAAALVVVPAAFLLAVSPDVLPVPSPEASASGCC